jgi:hypothetical protein
MGSREQVKELRLRLHFTEEVEAQLRESASRAKRSLTKEIEMRIEQSVRIVQESKKEGLI